MRYVLALTLLVAMGSASAFAQASGVTADVPFSFRIGSATFSPGVYTLTRLDDYGVRLVLRGKDGQIAVLPSATPLQSADLQKQSRLIFNHTGDDYALAQVWIAGRNIGEQFAAPAFSVREVVAGTRANTNGMFGQ